MFNEGILLLLVGKYCVMEFVVYVDGEEVCLVVLLIYKVELSRLLVMLYSDGVFKVGVLEVMVLDLVDFWYDVIFYFVDLDGVFIVFE